MDASANLKFFSIIKVLQFIICDVNYCIKLGQVTKRQLPSIKGLILNFCHTYPPIFAQNYLVVTILSIFSNSSFSFTQFFL